MRLLLLVACAAVSTLQGQNVSSGDRAYLVSHLEMTREFVRDATRGLTREQWLYKPAPLRWSIAQCIDHIANSEEYVLRAIRERALQSDAPLLGAFPSRLQGRVEIPTPRRMTPTEDAIVLRDMTDRTSSAARPVENRPPIEEVAPRDSFADPVTALEHFLEVRAATIDYVKMTDDPLRDHFIQTVLPVFPEVRFQDAFQWILRMSAHTEGHLAQVHEIRRSQGYPGVNN